MGTNSDNPCSIVFACEALYYFKIKFRMIIVMCCGKFALKIVVKLNSNINLRGVVYLVVVVSSWGS